MVVGAENMGAGIRVEENDTRITRVGRLLRRTSLDELPQLFNVIAGEMSLVGPRPGLRYQVELYSERQRGRLLVRPGITGLAQVCGRKAIDWDRRIELDLVYLEGLSLALDLKIMLRTVAVVVRGEGVARSDYWKEMAERAAGADPEQGLQRGEGDSLEGSDES
jgi:lipopolysaccharide/colanic/teichoic acid biosynthesis glycosyltransferase